MATRRGEGSDGARRVVIQGRVCMDSIEPAAVEPRHAVPGFGHCTEAI